MFNRFPIFRQWAPEWLIKIILFSLLLPSIVIFFLPITNVNAAAGYYGGEPLDMHFATVIFYCGYVGFYALERRFVSFFVAKEYFIVLTCLNCALCYGCYLTNELYLFFPIRLLQGMLFASTVSISLSVMFTRLKSERAREISFSVFFGLLLCAVPFNNLVTADLIDSFNYNEVYKIALFTYFPGLLMVLISMNNIRINHKFPLRKLDWQSFIIFTSILLLIGYICVFGQEYYWFTDVRIQLSFIALILFGIIYFIRQHAMKRPYIDLRVFKFKNFGLGIALLFIMYICRFAYGIMNSYFSTVLKFDPIHISYINLYNILGIVLGVILACIMVLEKKRIRFIWMIGFLFLLIFNVLMLTRFTPEANEDNFILPLIFHGFGVGMIMVPAIVYSISAVPLVLGSAASAICLMARYLGFCASILLFNFFDLYSKGKHFNTFQDRITQDNAVVQAKLLIQTNKLQALGLDPVRASKGAHKLLVERLNQQSILRYGIDYFEVIGMICLFTILLIAIFPRINRTAVNLRSKILPPA